MNDIFRIYVRKKTGFDVEAKHLLEDLREHLLIKGLRDLHLYNRYDIGGIEREQLRIVINLILCDPVVDLVYSDELPAMIDQVTINPLCAMPQGDYSFGSQYLAGQYDQRADSTEQCIRIVLNESVPIVQTAKIYTLFGTLSQEQEKKIEAYLINPVDSKSAETEKPFSLIASSQNPEPVQWLGGFIQMDEKSLNQCHHDYQLAMSLDDLVLCQDYFRKEARDPTITELKVIDTYWSDHCRHTTFSSILSSVQFEQARSNEPLKKTFIEFKDDFEKYYGNDRPLTLMDMATLQMKVQKKAKRLKELVVSDEINACTVEIEVNTPKGKIPYNLLFKNETHNHPTEIEPFGGAATCLGGAIRDPLSGRAYVYQSMRVTGSADPRTPLEKTIEGKLSQRKITTEAAHGFSSYGNQIGIATGMVKEYYHPGFMAKRLECGAVVGAVPSEHVKRERPVTGDLILLIGGDTGRDGCGGATGSSKSHEKESIEKCGAQVQKGNPPMERKLQRLFRNPMISRRIKKCNDFGAGGVSVAIGELADGLDINLDAVEKKYTGLDGTELAISESQERMAVVISPDDYDLFEEIANKENLKCYQVAKVTDSNRLKMRWKDQTIVDLSRDFLNTNGAKQVREVFVKAPQTTQGYHDNRYQRDPVTILEEQLSDLNACAQLGLGERFDSTIGSSTAFFPFGGEKQRTPTEVMAAYIPVETAETSTISLMAHGYDPYLTQWSPFHGGLYNVIHSCTKLIAAGGNPNQIWLSLQEYFEALREDPERWGKPFAALLGAYKAQRELGYAAIGGKDSMSGSFEDLDVPPTLISFAVSVAEANALCSNELKGKDHDIIYLKTPVDENLMPDFQTIRKHFQLVYEMIQQKKIHSCSSLDRYGILYNLCLRGFGNEIGFELFDTNEWDLLQGLPGSFLIECDTDSSEKLLLHGGKVIGKTIGEKVIKVAGKTKKLSDLEQIWLNPLDDIFPLKENIQGSEQPEFRLLTTPRKQVENKKINMIRKTKPRVFIPVFPGTNCEYDTQMAFERAGAQCQMIVFRNLTPSSVEESSEIFAQEISKSQILMIPGGFSAGDEPDGSGKFIAAVFRNMKIQQAVEKLLNDSDGLILGICNGFQALLRLGLLPYGEYRQPDDTMPTLTYNHIGRHLSTIANTKIISTHSPWFGSEQLGEQYKIPLSHTEGRFYCTQEMLQMLQINDQIATCYCGEDGTIDPMGISNPNGSLASIEGITSPDGRVLGKMGHNERVRPGLYINVPQIQIQNIFQNGVDYFMK